MAFHGFKTALAPLRPRRLQASAYCVVGLICLLPLICFPFVVSISKLWIYRNYIISLLRFHLCVDAGPFQSWNLLLLIFKKKWLNLPWSATHVILYYPGVCCISHVYFKLSLLACVSVSVDWQLQELGLQLYLGNVAL